MALLRDGRVEFSEWVGIPGESWSIGVPTGFSYSTDRTVNGESSSNPYGVYDLIIVKPRSNRNANFKRPYDNTVSFVSLEKYSNVQMNLIVEKIGLNWEDVVVSDPLTVKFAQFGSLHNVVSYQIAIIAGNSARRCQILVGTNDKKTDKREFVHQLLSSINISDEKQTASTTKTSSKAAGDSEKKSAPAKAKSEYTKVTDIVSVSKEDNHLFLINNEWKFRLPNGFRYETECAFDGGLKGGIDLSGSVKPMVIKGLASGDSFLFNFALEKHYDFFGNYQTVIDCRYDNRASGDSNSFSQRIITDGDDLFVDCISENLWPMGSSLKIRVRGDGIAPFDFTAFSDINSDVSEEDRKRVVDAMKEIAGSICLKNAKPGKKPVKPVKREAPADPNCILSGTVLQKYIGKQADVVLPEGITEIADNICSGRDDIRSLVVPEGVKKIGRRAFENCFELEEVFLPSTLKELGGYAFVDCHKLKHIDLGKVDRIEDSVFSECYVMEDVVIPQTVTKIESFAFKNCREFRTIVIPNKVESIGFSAFAYCSKMSYLYVPASVTEIRDNFMGATPFEGCDNLTIHAPAGSYAEEYCRSHSISFEADEHPKKAVAAKAPTSSSGNSNQNTEQIAKTVGSADMTLEELTYGESKTAKVTNELVIAVPDGYVTSDKGLGNNANWFTVIPEGADESADHIDVKPYSFGITAAPVLNLGDKVLDKSNIDVFQNLLVQQNALDGSVSILQHISSNHCFSYYQIWHQGDASEAKEYVKCSGFMVAGSKLHQFHFYANFEQPRIPDQALVEALKQIVANWLDKAYFIEDAAEKSAGETMPVMERATPDEALYPHYESMRRKGGGMPGMGVVVNQSGTEYAFFPFSYIADYTNDDDEEHAAAHRAYIQVIRNAIGQDTADYSLDQKAKEMQSLFRVNPAVFNQGYDRECMLEEGYLHRAYMFSALRSFAWTLGSFCNTSGKTPASVTAGELSAIVFFAAENDWLNYDGNTYFKGLCGGSDLHVYYVPDSLSESDRKKLLPSDEERERVAKTREMFPNYNAILDDVRSLNELRSDLESVYPAVKRLWDGLKKTRNYNKPLEGDAADIVFAWCALAKAAREPFYSEDGPMRCAFTQIKHKEDGDGERGQTPQKDTKSASVSEKTVAPKAGGSSKPAAEKAASRGSATAGKTSRKTLHFYSEEAIEEKIARKEEKAKKAAEALTKEETKKEPAPKKAAVYEGPAQFTVKDGVLKKYEGNEETVVVPAGVTGIGTNAFKDNLNIKKVILPEGLLFIDDSAFNGCSNLADINWVNTIEDIGKRAFKGCSSLETIIIPGNTINLMDNAFEDCVNLKTLIVHPDVIYRNDWYENNPFYNSFNKEITAYVKKGSNADKEWLSHEAKVKLVYDYPEEMMPKCTLSPEKKKYKQDLVLWKNILYKYRGTAETFVIPYGVKTIDISAFKKCSFKHIIIPNTVSTIKFRAFEGCAALESVEIPYGIKTLQQELFYGCKNLKFVTLPDTVQKVEFYVFSNCENLRSVNFPKDIKIINKDVFGNPQYFNTPYDLTIYGYYGSIAESFAHANNINFSTGLPNGIPAPRTATSPDPTEKALKEIEEAEKKRKMEKEKRLAEEKRRAEEQAKQEAESKRLAEERVKKLDALITEKETLLKTIEENRGIFGEKAKRRKEAKQRLAVVEDQILKLTK